MAGSARSDLVSTLRTRINDERTASTAFTLSVTNTAKSAILEISNGFLNVTVTGGENVESIRWNLSQPSYATVGRVIEALGRQTGYSVLPDAAVNVDHPSVDLRVDGLADISKAGKATPVKHRIFSDQELLDLLEEAVTVHNPNYSIASAPKAEYPYILKKASASVFRTMAADASKRKGLDTDVKSLLALAEDLERQYREDTTRNLRLVPAPKLDESSIGSGHIMQGTLVRPSLRTGIASSVRAGTSPTPPQLYDPADDDVEDTVVRLRWSQNRDANFARYEVWRDMQPSLERCSNGYLHSQLGVANAYLPQSTQYMRVGTSRQVMEVGWGYASQMFADIGSSLVNPTFVDGLIYDQFAGSASTLGEPLEPDFDYYYRIYAISQTGEVVPSEVKKIRTKPRRALFSRSSLGVLNALAISPQTGPISGGTTVTILGTSFVDGMVVLIGGKKATISSKTSTQLTVVTPAFSNADFLRRPMDIVLVSPTGLRDIAAMAWMFTS